MRFFYVFICLISMVVNLSLAFANANDKMTASKSFQTRLNQAYEAGNARRFARSIGDFKELLRDHPKEVMVYDFYARVLSLKGEYREAINLYEKALPLASSRGEEQISQMRLAIEELERREAFEAAMLQQPTWRGAITLGSQEVIIKTNIPQEYYWPFAKEFSDVLYEVRALMRRILGAPIESYQPLRLYIVGREEDYTRMIKERGFDRTTRGRIVRNSFYDAQKNETIIYFNGVTDWYLMAYQIVQHVLHNEYIAKPSKFLSEGLSDYIATKVKKHTAKSTMVDRIKSINWLFDQGHLEYSKSLFLHWGRTIPTFYVTEELKALDPYYEDAWATGTFYLMSWSLVHFFLEGDSAYFSNFFSDLIQYEINNQRNDWESTFYYFRGELGEDGFKQLDYAWGRHTLNLTYDTL